MSDVELLEKTGAEAVLELRKNKLAAGKPFMINSKDLPANQSYLEYPNATIAVVTVAPGSQSFQLIRELSEKEARAVRKKLNLA